MQCFPARGRSRGPEAAWYFTFNDDEEDKIDALRKKFKEHCEGKKNLTVIRYRFNTHNQKKGEQFDAYLTSLKAKVTECEYGDLEQSLLTDRIITGIHEDILREKLLQSENLTLDKCTTMCRLNEIKTSELSGKSAAVDAIRYRKGGKKSQYRAPEEPQNPRNHGNQTPKDFRDPSVRQKSGPPKSSSEQCRKCGGLPHRQYQKCPAFGKKCNSCGNMNHYARMCLNDQRRPPRRVHDVDVMKNPMKNQVNIS